MTAPTRRFIRIAGFLVGCSLALGAVLSGRVPEGRAGAGAGITLSTRSATEFGVSPAGEILAGRNLQPGGRAARGKVQLASFADRPILVRLRLSSGRKDLDQVLLIELNAAGKRIFRGPLGELRSWTKRRLALAPGQRRSLTVRAWVPASVSDGHQGRSVDADLEWKVGR